MNDDGGQHKRESSLCVRSALSLRGFKQRRRTVQGTARFVLERPWSATWRGWLGMEKGPCSCS